MFGLIFLSCRDNVFHTVLLGAALRLLSSLKTLESTLWPLSDLTVTHTLTSSLTEVNVTLFFLSLSQAQSPS